MTSRTRNKDLQLWASGGARRKSDNYQLIAPASGTAETVYCFDSIQSPPYVNDQPLTIIRRLANPLWINGEATQYGNGLVVYTDYAPPNRANATACPTPTAVDGSYWTTKALANADPFNPAVDLPLFAFELKDFPGMLKELGHVLKGKIKPSSVPGGYLSYRFGWAPLVSDVKSLLNFSRLTDNRVRYFRNLESRSPIKRTLFSGEIKRTVSKDGYKLLSNTPSVPTWGYTADIETVETLRVWYTANAKLLRVLPDMPSELRRMAFKATYGLNVRAETLWDAIPWTWLSDYLFNIGDFISAYQGLTHLKMTRFNLMMLQDVRSRLVNVRIAAGGLDATSSELQTVQKTRSVSSNPTPRITSTPFLSKGQEGILGALITASALRGVKR